jgi:hypothetical protein
MAFVLFWALDSCMDKGSQSWICWQSNACWDCHSYFSELTKVKFANVRNSMDGDSSVFKDKCLQWINIFFCLVLVDIVSFGRFQQGSHCFWTWKTTQKLVLFTISALQKSLERSICFPSVKQNLIQTCCSFKSDFFQVFQNWKYVNTHVCNKTLLSNYACCRLVLCRK